jgi:hypothetical protein
VELQEDLCLIQKQKLVPWLPDTEQVLEESSEEDDFLEAILKN